ncbi:hypothetical protein CDL12_08610 [Handroanthus impetiginosus]|uniref:Uncharacterized protein n=1 Tax=Handroanthus impetiginosus TaxID=429701 RepID=A0A2G9HMF4_9LAMI|nr:hypothetical protein CDL12_08610 [Handroanthus impetiginosus]
MSWSVERYLVNPSLILFLNMAYGIAKYLFKKNVVFLIPLYWPHFEIYKHMPPFCCLVEHFVMRTNCLLWIFVPRRCFTP